MAGLTEIEIDALRQNWKLPVSKRNYPPSVEYSLTLRGFLIYMPGFGYRLTDKGVGYCRDRFAESVGAA